MEIYLFVLYLIGMLISAYYTDMLIGLVVKRKYKRYWYTIIYAVLNLIHVYLSDYVFESLKFKYANFYIVNWLFIYLLYKGTTLKKALAYMRMLNEEGKNAIQRGETTDSDKRYASFKKIADNNFYERNRNAYTGYKGFI